MVAKKSSKWTCRPAGGKVKARKSAARIRKAGRKAKVQGAKVCTIKRRSRKGARKASRSRRRR